jgi:MoaA/NifB/PqqE/SkfB family radical SAM enzyme
LIKIIKYLSYGAKFVIDKRILKKDRAFIAGLVLGESCNLNCEHCNVCHESQENDLSFKMVEKGLNELYKEGIKLLAITGGEPFYWQDQDKNLEDVIALARKIGFLIISVYTNGTFQLNCSADDLFVSIDGLKENSHKLRGPVHDQVISNIKTSNHKNIMINFTINTENKNEIEDFCEYIATIKNIKGIFFYFHTPYYGKDGLFIPFEARQKIILKLLKLKNRYKILNSKATLLDVYYNRWERPSSICKVYSKDKIFTCCRSVENKDACEDCGYLGYPEVINITKLKPSALLTALNYMP